ncbi:MAG: chorismate mutase [bacterium P3]|nr:MAG: chorismate mutase [bacterium P201]KWW30363.1 MAG: chorismate mutase [bacterium P3]KWW32858.1 MAG: chorismate mutase [bacterium F083]
MHPIFHSESKPFVIAGPCSVESRKQLHDCVTSLETAAPVDMVRCGIWKPRTRPGGFEGLGEPALSWVDELHERHPSLRFCCEVARPEHVELCLNHHIDAVWIGARTSGNPFSVGELAQALRGSSLAVMVKNPIAADVSLWQGAIERVLQAGVSDVAAIHRGFHLYHDGVPYRNKPLWEVPVELRRRMPDLPLLCDPSHMGGHRRYLEALMLTAADLGYDGYMIEVHPHPAEALTDREQQIDATGLRHLLERLALHRQEGDADIRLNILRQQIDAIDERLIQAMGDRMEISRKIAQMKQACHMAAYQPQRWEALMRERIAAARAAGLDAGFMRTLYETIHAESIRIQEDIMNNKQ